MHVGDLLYFFLLYASSGQTDYSRQPARNAGGGGYNSSSSSSSSSSNSSSMVVVVVVVVVAAASDTDLMHDVMTSAKVYAFFVS